MNAAQIRVCEGLNHFGNPGPIHRIDRHGIFLLGADVEAVEMLLGRELPLVPREGASNFTYFRLRHLLADTELSAQMSELLCGYGVEVSRPSVTDYAECLGFSGVIPMFVRECHLVQLRCRRENWRATFGPAFHDNGTRRRNTWKRVKNFGSYLANPHVSPTYVR